MEFDYSEIYAPLDLDVGHCRLAVAAPADWAGAGRSAQLEPCPRRDQISGDHPPPFRGARRPGRVHQAQRRDRAGAALGLCRHIVDLVQTGATLKANGLVEIEHIAEVTSRLIVNRPALKTRPEEVGRWIERFRAAVAAGNRRARRIGAVARRGSGCDGAALMPITLSTRDPGFEAAFRRCSPPSARARPMSTPRSPRSSTMSRPRRCGADRIHAALRPDRSARPATLRLTPAEIAAGADCGAGRDGRGAAPRGRADRELPSPPAAGADRLCRRGRRAARRALAAGRRGRALRARAAPPPIPPRC